jgi:YD repeat-containing protein
MPGHSSVGGQLTYDAERNSTRITHPDGWFFQYGFNGLNRFDGLEESVTANPSAGTTNLLAMSYWASGGRKDITRPSGATTGINFDPVLRLYDFTQNISGTANDLTNALGYNSASQVVFLVSVRSRHIDAGIRRRA